MDKDKRHLYPYEDSSDSMVFRIPEEQGENVSRILIDTKGNKKAENSVDVFKLDRIYQAHINEVSELKGNVMDYFESGKEKAYKVLYGIEIPFDISGIWFSFMGKGLCDEPLIKLKQDIFKQIRSVYER